ncbi:MAG TPA: hypothetical protein VGM32_24680 [Rhodopila sp.]
MLHFAFTVVVLAGVLATAHPAPAGPAATTGADHAQAAAAEQPAPQPARTSAESGKEVPVGFGWG